VVSEPGAEHLLGLFQVSHFAKLFAQRIEETALRISLQLEAELLDFRRARCHISATAILA